jgi:predicted MPP superfamily phosphohydrolase
MAITPVLIPWTLLIILSQFLAWRYFLNRLKKRYHRIPLNFIYIIANILGVYALLSTYVLDFQPPISFLWDFVVRPGLIWEYAHLFWLIPASLIFLLKALWGFLRREPKGLSKLFRAEKSGPSLWDLTGLCLIAILILSFYGYAHQLKDPIVERVSLYYPDLPEELEGFRIAALSDFHYGRGVNEEDLQRIFDLTAMENPDMVVLLGNLVHKKSLLSSAFKDPLLKFKNSGGGVFAVLGDYDTFTDNPHNVTQILTNAGVRVLVNELFNHPETPLTVMGFTDPGTPVWTISPLELPDQNLPLPWGDLRGPVPPEGNFVILLNNRPIDIPAAEERGEADLFLAGHVRGGLISLPWNKQQNLASLFYDYSSGSYRLGKMEVYVTRGLAAPVTPVRLFAWPEITILTLEKSTLAGPQEESQGREEGGQSQEGSQGQEGGQDPEAASGETS